MKEEGQASAEFIQRFVDLSKRLATMGVAIHTADLQWGSFGSWTLMVIKRHEAVRFEYDGRDSIMTVKSSPARNYSYPNEWKELMITAMEKKQDDAIAFVEDFIRAHYNG